MHLHCAKLLIISCIFHVIKCDSTTSYRFSYSTGGIGPARSFREERRDTNGVVIGKYGYVDPNGQLRVVHYTAGPKGFQAFGDTGPDEKNTKIANELVHQDYASKYNFLQTWNEIAARTPVNLFWNNQPQYDFQRVSLVTNNIPKDINFKPLAVTPQIPIITPIEWYSTPTWTEKNSIVIPSINLGYGTRQPVSIKDIEPPISINNAITLDPFRFDDLNKEYREMKYGNSGKKSSLNNNYAFSIDHDASTRIYDFNI